MTCLLESEVTLHWDFDHVRLYENAVSAVLDAERCPYDVQVALLVTDDEQMRMINRDTRNIDRVTDVLSFPMLKYERPSDFSDVDPASDMDPDTGELVLGDIVMSVDRVVAQAGQYGHDIQREFAFLIVHSMLHLCGYDHNEYADRKLMEERQKIIMESLYNDFPKLTVNR